MDSESASQVHGILKEGQLMKRRDFLPKWDRRTFQLEIDMNYEDKEDQVVIKMFTTSGGTPLKTKTLIGAKIKLTDSGKRQDCGRLDIVFNDGERYRLNAKDRFDRQAWIDDIVMVLQEFSENPLETDDIVEFSHMSISSQSSHLDQSMLSSAMSSPRIEGGENNPSTSRNRPYRMLEKINSGVEIGEVQDPINRRIKGRSKSQGKDRMIRREKSRKRVERTLSSLSGSQRGSQRDSFNGSRRNSIKVMSETNKTEEELPGSPRLPLHRNRSGSLNGSMPNFQRVKRGPSLLSSILLPTISSHQRDGLLHSQLLMSPGITPRSPGLLDALVSVPERQDVGVKKAKSDVAALVRKSLSGKLERIHDNSTTPSAAQGVEPPKRQKPTRNKTVARGVSFRQDVVTTPPASAPQSDKLKIRVPSFGRGKRNSQSSLPYPKYQDQSVQFSPRQQQDVGLMASAGVGSMNVNEEPMNARSGVHENLKTQQSMGKKWKLIKNVMDLMPGKTHAEKIDDYLGELVVEQRMSYKVSPINTDINELDLFTSIQDPNSVMVASIHEHYLRAQDFVQNNEGLFPVEMLSKFSQWARAITRLQNEAPAAAIAAKSFYVFEVTKVVPSWCCTGLGPAMRLGYASPQQLIVDLLHQPDLNNLVWLKECISYSSPEWVAMFYRLQGFDALFEVQNIHLNIARGGVADALDAVLQVLMCLQALLSSDKGMELAIEDKNFVQNLLRVFEFEETEKDAHKFLAIMILTSIMLYDEAGYQRVLQGILHSQLQQSDVVNISPSSQLDDIAEHGEDGHEESGSISVSDGLQPVRSGLKLQINTSYIRALANMLNTDKGDINLDLCDNVIKFMSAVLVTAETVGERKLRKQFVHALQRCEIYSVLELLTCDMTFVGNDAILEEIDNLKCHIAACLNDVIVDDSVSASVSEDEVEITDNHIEQKDQSHFVLPRSESAAERSLQTKDSGARDLKKVKSLPTPPPLPPKVPPHASGSKGGKSSGPRPLMKMKQLFWDKIPGNRTKGTFWEKVMLLRVQCIDFKELERLFQAMVKRSNAPTKVNQKKLKVLDIKRATTIGILLNKFPVPWEKLRDTIVTLDTTMFRSTEDVGALIECLPKQEERNKMESYLQSNGSKEGLSEAELVCMDLMQIPRAEARLGTFQKKFIVQEKLNEAYKILDTHVVAMRQLQTSRVFRLILQAVLVVGNFMNYGSSRLGNASGFKLKNLSKLQDTRSLDSKTSLLSYIANQICKSGYPILSDEMPAVLRPEIATCLGEVYELLCWIQQTVDDMEEELEQQPPRAVVVFNVDISDYNPDVQNRSNSVEYSPRESDTSAFVTDESCTNSSTNSGFPVKNSTSDTFSSAKADTISDDEQEIENSPRELTSEEQMRLETLDKATKVKVSILVDNYQDIMSQETSKIKKRLKVLMEKYQACHVQFEKLISYYGDNLQTLNEKDFWTSIVGFVERFSMHQRSAYRDLKDEIEKRKRSLKRQLTSKKDLGVGDLEKMMATLLQQQGVTDLDAQVEAILIKEFGVDRLSLGANGPEAARRAMLMKIFSTSQKELGTCNTMVTTTTTESTSATPIPADEETGERRAHVRQELAREKVTISSKCMFALLYMLELMENRIPIFDDAEVDSQFDDIMQTQKQMSGNGVAESEKDDDGETTFSDSVFESNLFMSKVKEVEMFKMRVQQLEQQRDHLIDLFTPRDKQWDSQDDLKSKLEDLTFEIRDETQLQLESLMDQVCILMEKASQVEYYKHRTQDLEKHRDLLSQRLLLEGDGRNRSFRLERDSRNPSFRLERDSRNPSFRLDSFSRQSSRNQSFRLDACSKQSSFNENSSSQVETLQNQVYILMEKAIEAEQFKKRIQDLERHRDMLSQRLLVEGDGRSTSFKLKPVDNSYEKKAID